MANSSVGEEDDPFQRTSGSFSPSRQNERRRMLLGAVRNRTAASAKSEQRRLVARDSSPATLAPRQALLTKMDALRAKASEQRQARMRREREAAPAVDTVSATSSPGEQRSRRRRRRRHPDTSTDAYKRVATNRAERSAVQGRGTLDDAARTARRDARRSRREQPSERTPDGSYAPFVSPIFNDVATPEALRERHKALRAQLRADEPAPSGVTAAQIERAQRSIVEGDFGAAAQVLEGLSAARPEDLALHHAVAVETQIAQCCHSMGADRRAIAAYRRALRLDPHNGELNRCVGLILFDEKEYEDCVAAMWFAAQSGAHDAEAMMKTAMCHCELRDYAAAKATAQALLDIDPSNPLAAKLMLSVEQMKEHHAVVDASRQESDDAARRERERVERLLLQQQAVIDQYRSQVRAQDVQLEWVRRGAHERERAARELDELRGEVRAFHSGSARRLDRDPRAPADAAPKLPLDRLLLQIDRGPSSDPKGERGEVAQIREMLDDGGVWYSQTLREEESHSFVISVMRNCTI